MSSGMFITAYGSSTADPPNTAMPIMVCLWMYPDAFAFSSCRSKASCPALTLSPAAWRAWMLSAMLSSTIVPRR